MPPVPAFLLDANFVDLIPPGFGFRLRGRDGGVLKVNVPPNLENTEFALPVTSGTQDQVLSIDSSGNLSWISGLDILSGLATGALRVVTFAVDAATVIGIGDLVFLDEDDVKNAGLQEDQLTLAANQELFHDGFAGVALEASVADQTDPIKVAVWGVFDYPCVSDTFEVGDLIGIAEADSGTELENQKVIKVAAANLSIGRCVQRVPAPDTTVRIELVSSVLYGGVQVPV